MKPILRAAVLAIAAAASPSLACAAEKLVVAWSPNPQTPQVDVALAEGYFEDAGLEIEFISFVSGREGFEALLGGQVDIAVVARHQCVDHPGTDLGSLRNQQRPSDTPQWAQLSQHLRGEPG